MEFEQRIIKEKGKFVDLIENIKGTINDDVSVVVNEFVEKVSAGNIEIFPNARSWRLHYGRYEDGKVVLFIPYDFSTKERTENLEYGVLSTVIDIVGAARGLNGPELHEFGRYKAEVLQKFKSRKD